MEKYKKLERRDFNDFENKFNKNVLTLNLTSWDEFCNVARKFKKYPDYIWRGQRREDFELKSSFDRFLKRKFHNINNRQRKLDQIFNNFKRRLEDLPNKKSGITEDEIWAIGQHYGLRTPLLDWTECPYIAAYFAFYKKSGKERTENRVIFALNRAAKLLKKITKDAKSKKVLSKKRFIEFPDLENKENKLDEMQNERLKKQKGKFTKALNGGDMKINVERFSNKEKYKGKIFLAKILIPDTAKIRDECIEFLESKKITHGTLFPDFAGAVEICKNDIGMEKS